MSSGKLSIKTMTEEQDISKTEDEIDAKEGLNALSDTENTLSLKCYLAYRISHTDGKNKKRI